MASPSGVVQVALRDQGERPAELGGQRVHGVGQLGQEVPWRLVQEGVHGVEPQRVDVEVAQPPQRVVDEYAAPAAARAVEVDPGPQGWVPVGEVRTEPRQVVPRRAEVVVDDVEEDAQAPRVAGVDEPRSAAGPP